MVTSTAVSLQNVLCATDFSPCSDSALFQALGLCRRYGSTLYTVHVVREEFSEVQPPDPFYLLHSAEKKMADLAQSERFGGIRHRELLREGDVSRVLRDLIEGLEIDLLVLGTRGRGGIKKLLLGSIAEEILGSVQCPVLTVGPHVSPKPEEGRLHEILCATDLQEPSCRALEFAIALTEREHSRLTLVHVVKPLTDAPGDYLEAATEDAKRRIRELLPTGAGVEADFAVEVGMPGERIAWLASQRKANLIVMGTHHGSFARMSSHLPWVTPHQVLCQANCPVVTVPAGQEAR